MALFANNGSKGGPPVELVGQLRSQNRSDHEIIDELSKQGYSSIDIYNALNQADGSNAQGPQPDQPGSQQNPGQQIPDIQESASDPWANQPQQPFSGSQEPQTPPATPSQPPGPQAPPSIFNDAPSQPMPQAQQNPPAYQQNPPARHTEPVFQGSDTTIDQLDQIAEAIIDEKWKEMKSYIEKIVDWKGKVENRILAVEENQRQLNEQLIGLQKSMLDKVQNYDRHITDVGTEIKAMEKVFQKIIPTLTENVNELSNVVHRMKDD